MASSYSNTDQYHQVFYIYIHPIIVHGRYDYDIRELHIMRRESYLDYGKKMGLDHRLNPTGIFDANDRRFI